MWRCGVTCEMRPRRTAYVQVYPPCPAVYVSRGVRLSSFKARGSLLQRGSWVTPPGGYLPIRRIFSRGFRLALGLGGVGGGGVNSKFPRYLARAQTDLPVPYKVSIIPPVRGLAQTAANRAQRPRPALTTVCDSNLFSSVRSEGVVVGILSPPGRLEGCRRMFGVIRRHQSEGFRPMAVFWCSRDL